MLSRRHVLAAASGLFVGQLAASVVTGLVQAKPSPPPPNQCRPTALRCFTISPNQCDPRVWKHQCDRNDPECRCHDFTSSPGTTDCVCKIDMSMP